MELEIDERLHQAKQAWTMRDGGTILHLLAIRDALSVLNILLETEDMHLQRDLNEES